MFNFQMFSVGILANEFTSSINIIIQFFDISKDVPYFDTILHSLSIIHAFVECFVGAYEITGVDKSDVHNDFIFAHTAELDGKLLFLLINLRGELSFISLGQILTNILVYAR